MNKTIWKYIISWIFFFGAIAFILYDKNIVWGPIGSISAFLIIQVTFLYDYLEDTNTKKIEADKQMYSELIKLLPSDSDCVIGLRDKDLGGPFSTTLFDPLSEFKHKFVLAEYCFINKELEQEKNLLIKKINEFNRIFLPNVFEKNGVLRVPVEWRESKPQMYKEATDNLNEIATEIFTIHQSLIKKCKIKLKV